MKQLRDTTLRNQTLSFDGREMQCLGPSLVLEGCTINLRATSKTLTLTGVRLTDCQLVIKQKLLDFYWCNAYLQRCRFTGMLAGCDFGNWPEYFESSGGIESCDFSQATLDACRFMGCDATTLILPSWPCFTLMDPLKLVPKLEANTWPENVDALFATIGENPTNTAAITYWAPSIVKDFGGTEQELRAALARVGLV